ncbi:MAG: RNA-binding protein [Bacillota bacterium]
MLKLTHEAKEFLAKIEDKVDIVLERHINQVTEFADPFLINCGVQYLSKISGINFLAYGGVEGVERKRIIICPDYIEPKPPMANVAILEFHGNLEYIKCSHRDFLGALLGQGVKREKLGDIFPADTGFTVIVAGELKDYFYLHPLKIKGVEFSSEIKEGEQWGPPSSDGKVIQTTVPSLRLDSITACGFGLSRTKVTSFIKGGKVKVNWQVVENLDYHCRQGDVISFRGKGRVVITEVGNETKKGRLKVILTRYG